MRIRFLKRRPQIKWTSFLMELVLIIVGINIGLWLNNLNEQRKDRQLEEKILLELKNALKKDLEDVKDNAAVHYDGLLGCQKLLSMLHDTKPLSPDSVRIYGQNATGWTFLVADISTYEYLKSVGWHHISNDSLRNKISDLYHVEYKYIYEIEDQHKRRKELLTQHYESYFDANAQNYYLIHSEALKADHVLRFHLKMMQYSHHSLMLKYTAGVQPAIEQLLLDIEAAL